MTPTIENRNLEYKKVISNGEGITHIRFNAVNVDEGVLEYVRKQMHREEVTGEVIGEAIIFQEGIEEFERELEG